MNFISLEFLSLFLICFCAHHLSPQKWKKHILLASSCVFIGYFHLMFLIVALGVAFFAYAAGVFIENSEEQKRINIAYGVSIGLIIAFWIVCRNTNTLFGTNNFLFPLGISFYSFQAIAYLTEIYWGDEKAERSLVDFMVYMLLFLKFLSGPIERPTDLLPQIKSLKSVSYEMCTYGMKLILIGLIKKLVVADQIAPYVDPIFDSPQLASGLQLFMACLLYPIELYTDFSGYTDIAIGGAMLFGLRLTPNFNRPFIAETTSELWRRWHMSLSFWVRDYFFIPLSSLLRKYGETGVVISLLTTFALLGMWHGTGLTFIVYGLIQGVSIVYELKAKSMREQFRNIIGSKVFSVWSVMRMYMIFAISLIFFRCNSMSDAVYFFSNISFKPLTIWKEMNLGMSDHICIVAGSGLFLVLLYEFYMARFDLLKRMETMPVYFRWGIYYLLVFALLEYGKWGADNFIYLQF